VSTSLPEANNALSCLQVAAPHEPAPYESCPHPQYFEVKTKPTLSEIIKYGEDIERDFHEANLRLLKPEYDPIPVPGVEPFISTKDNLQRLCARAYDNLRYMLYLVANMGREDCIFLAISPVTDQGIGFVREQLHFTQLYVLNNGSSPDLSPKWVSLPFAAAIHRLSAQY
jgi:hypothetical protein